MYNDFIAAEKELRKMSVIKSKRLESTMEFLDTMKKIHKEVISLCMRCPKRWDRFLTGDIAHLANMAMIRTKRGNSIYPTTQEEVQLRRNEFINATADLRGLISMLGNLFDYAVDSGEYGIKSSRMESIMLLIETEINLLRGLMRKDAARYKTLPTRAQKQK